MNARRPWAWPLVPVYAAALAAKDGLRRVGLLRTKPLQWPVVSVGSLSAGGAGKTPVVIALAKLLLERDWAVDVLSRGYGREGRGVERVDAAAIDAAQRFGDEPVLIARNAAVPVWVGAERFAAGRAAEQAIKDRPFDFDSGVHRKVGRMRCLHLLDDGFQHRRLARNVDIVLVTAEDLGAALLPAGNLRERWSALRRADVVVVREEEADRVVPWLDGRVERDCRVWRVRRQISFPGASPVLFPDRPTYGHIVFSAIARPADFAQMLQETGVYALEEVRFPDHHAYTAEDMRKLVETLDLVVGNGFVTTEKDAVKLSPELRAQLEAAGPLVIARLDAVFIDEMDAMRDLEARLS